jgi:hypothetical protein
MPSLYEQIAVDLKTGKISYPQITGFRLDMERLYRTVELFAPHCQTMEQAVKQAVHGQLTAYQGAQSLRRR